VRFSSAPARVFVAPLLALFIVFTVSVGVAAIGPEKSLPTRGPELSAMGAIASGRVPVPTAWTKTTAKPSLGGPGRAPQSLADGEVNVTPNAPFFQSETSVAAHGDTVVAGFNDADGFSNPAGPSVSGFSYSHDGGATFTYGGQLPVLGGGDQVFGDPDVKVWVNPSTGAVVFVYSSIYVTTGGLSSLCVHVSTDGGVTWAGPREVTPVNSSTDFADKEFIDIDPETGRILLSFSNFGSASFAMQATYSDDLALTWSTPVSFDTRASGGQGSCPRFDPNSNRAYIVWRSFGGTPDAVSLATSTDNGATWGAPVDIVSNAQPVTRPYGSDRINGFPALDVSPVNGRLHVVYGSGQSGDFGDVYYLQSSDGGATWTTPIALNTFPGADRAQFFGWVTAQSDGGVDRVDATWYDQRAGTGTSDLTEMMHVHSTDGGATWSQPTPLTPRPFHAEYGNDTGQPNLGDYAQCDGDGGRLFACYARTDAPDHQTSAPDTYVAAETGAASTTPFTFAGVASVNDIGCVTDGFLVADELADLTFNLTNESSSNLASFAATLTTTTPGVTIINGSAIYGTMAAGATIANAAPYRVRLDPLYPCGTDIDFTLAGTAALGPFRVNFTMPTGVVDSTVVLFSENFDGVTSGLPAGWTNIQVKGVSNPWQVSNTHVQSGTRSLFCLDRPDTNRSRVESPSFVVPAGFDRLEVSFAETHDIEEVGDGRQGYDGAMLKMNVDGSDYVAGHFASSWDQFYPLVIVRGSGPSANPLQDLAAWSGNTLPNFTANTINYPGLAGSTVKLVFEMGSDISVGATGVFIDDIVVRAVRTGCGTCTAAPVLAVAPSSVTFGGLAPGDTACATVTIHNTGDGFLDVNSVTGCDVSPFFLDLTGMAAEVVPGDSTSFQVCAIAGSGADSCNVTVATNAGNAGVPVFLDVVLGLPGDDGNVAGLQLGPVVPNPFSSAAAIRFSLAEAGPARLDVFDLQGRRIGRVLDARMEAGEHQVRWDGRDDAGTPVAAGIYFMRLEAGGQTRVARAVKTR